MRTCGQVQRLILFVLILRTGWRRYGTPLEAEVQLFGRNGLSNEECFGHDFSERTCVRTVSLCESRSRRRVALSLRTDCKSVSGSTGGPYAHLIPLTLTTRSHSLKNSLSLHHQKQPENEE